MLDYRKDRAMARIVGLATLRITCREMLKVLDKYGRRLRAFAPEYEQGTYENAVRQIIEGCETILSIKFTGEE